MQGLTFLCVQIAVVLGVSSVGLLPFLQCFFDSGRYTPVKNVHRICPLLLLLPCVPRLQAFAGWMLQHGGLFDADTPGFSRLQAQAEELLQDPRVDTNAAFWGTVHRMVLLGQLDMAMTLLAHHPVAQAGQDEGMAGLVGCG